MAAQRLELQQLRTDLEMLDMVGAALAAQGAESISQEQRRLRLLCEVRVPRLTLHRPQPHPQPTPRLHLHPSPLSPPPAQAVCALSAADKGTVVQAPPYSQLATCFSAVLLPACYLPATCLLPACYLPATRQELLAAMAPDERGPLLTQLLGTMLPDERTALLEASRYN